MQISNRRRRGHRGSAWYWTQTDSWYYTPKGTTKRVPLFDEEGRRLRGKENRQAAALAVARAKLATDWRPESASASERGPGVQAWLVADACSRFIEFCQRRLAAGSIHPEYESSVRRYLNELCTFCGALSVTELKKGHVQLWLDRHSTWRPVTRRNVVTIVLAAFNHAQREFNVRNPLRGFKKPPPQPRLDSFSSADEQAIYEATDTVFREFLFAAVHTGLHRSANWRG